MEANREEATWEVRSKIPCPDLHAWTMRGLALLLLVTIAVNLSIQRDEATTRVTCLRPPPLLYLRGGQQDKMKATRAGLEEAKKRWQQKKDRQTMQDEQETKSRHHAYVSQDVGHQSSSSYNESALFNLESMPSHISDNDKAAQEVGGWGMLVGGQEEFALHGLKNKSSSRRSNKVDKYEHLASLEESISQSEKELQMLRKRVTSVKPNHPLAEALDLKENSEAEDESFDDEDLLRDSDMYEKDGDYLLVNETDNEVVSSISNIQMVEELCSASQLKEGLPYQVVLDEHWGPSKEDSDLLSYEAGRLIGDMPLEVQIIDCNESDANILERFHECPDVLG
ncbi:hypothetical protein GUITHDRAFT_162571 [Guillardia theta CCMP2712]|uniref:Uncharacterized protein n=1 Tax=Guillardia theta (strain CCMP2712) TaxID=905079 RepID=L1JGZ0_GUITC|nr:hypothetical protein GUITHDRAFT_162571 [Guillardia theta CCMP2712]EKX47768.1 hypothetical protein GUITHDRAFT_162571 [Guillardia theta CCMP2712]|eukprot:XP_005834748.1 hypothetical protein GUITHDRAFT_162571 [Guillardia theta CCMP2712]